MWRVALSGGLATGAEIPVDRPGTQGRRAGRATNRLSGEGRWSGAPELRGRRAGPGIRGPGAGSGGTLGAETGR